MPAYLRGGALRGTVGLTALGVVLWASLIAPVAALAGPGPLSGGRFIASPIAGPSTGAYFGAYVDPQGKSWQSAVQSFETMIGRKLRIDASYLRWGSSLGARASSDLSSGRIPEIAWHGAKSTAITSGSYDSYIRAVANSLKSLSGRVFLRYGREMNLSKEQTWVVSPSAYIAAWKHIHNVFQQQGVTNVTWVWSPTAGAFFNGGSLATSYYPGDTYVDWIAVDGFNAYGCPQGAGLGWREFSTIMRPFYQWAGPRGKPLMVAETGSSEDPQKAGRKGGWITNASSTLKSWPKIKAFLYFHSNQNSCPWWVNTSTSSLSAYKTMAKDPYFNP